MPRSKTANGIPLHARGREEHVGQRHDVYLVDQRHRFLGAEHGISSFPDNAIRRSEAQETINCGS
jgi:hypothetical protein